MEEVVRMVIKNLPPPVFPPHLYPPRCSLLSYLFSIFAACSLWLPWRKVRKGVTKSEWKWMKVKNKSEWKWTKVDGKGEWKWMPSERKKVKKSESTKSMKTRECKGRCDFFQLLSRKRKRESARRWLFPPSNTLPGQPRTLLTSVSSLLSLLPQALLYTPRVVQ
jgi:hypothetical protein